MTKNSFGQSEANKFAICLIACSPETTPGMLLRTSIHVHKIRRIRARIVEAIIPMWNQLIRDIIAIPVRTLPLSLQEEGSTAAQGCSGNEEKDWATLSHGVLSSTTSNIKATVHGIMMNIQDGTASTLRASSTERIALGDATETAKIANGDGVETSEDIAEAMMANGAGVGASDETGAVKMARRAGAVGSGDALRTREAVEGGMQVPFTNYLRFRTKCLCMR